jgi:hypothetical protein
MNKRFVQVFYDNYDVRTLKAANRLKYWDLKAGSFMQSTPNKLSKYNNIRNQAGSHSN